MVYFSRQELQRIRKIVEHNNSNNIAMGLKSKDEDLRVIKKIDEELQREKRPCKFELCEDQDMSISEEQVAFSS